MVGLLSFSLMVLVLCSRKNGNYELCVDVCACAKVCVLQRKTETHESCTFAGFCSQEKRSHKLCTFVLILCSEKKMGVRNHAYMNE